MFRTANVLKVSLISVPAALLIAALPAQGATYVFRGNCEDCAVAAGAAAFPVTGVLELVGDPVQNGDVGPEDFLVWSYNGSNLLDPYIAVANPQGTDSPPWQHAIYSVAGTIVGGQIDTLDLRFGDGLEFLLAADGTWSSCGINDNGYYGVPCSWQTAADYGTVTSFRPPIPEPGTYALMVLGLLGLLARRRHAAG